MLELTQKDYPGGLSEACDESLDSLSLSLSLLLLLFVFLQ